MIDVEQRSLRALEQDRITTSGGLVQEMTRIAKEWREALNHRGRFIKD